MAANKPLTIKQQIKVLRSAKALYKRKNKIGSHRNCMCYCICEIIEERFDTGYLDCEELVDFIPSFNIDNVESAGIQGLIPAIEKRLGWWWDTENTAIRPLVFDWLISELEKQL